VYLRKKGRERCTYRSFKNMAPFFSLSLGLFITSLIGSLFTMHKNKNKARRKEEKDVPGL
jgi:hypothetical protein